MNTYTVNIILHAREEEHRRVLTGQRGRPKAPRSSSSSRQEANVPSPDRHAEAWDSGPHCIVFIMSGWKSDEVPRAENICDKCCQTQNTAWMEWLVSPLSVALSSVEEKFGSSGYWRALSHLVSVIPPSLVCHLPGNSRSRIQLPTLSSVSARPLSLHSS